MEESWREMERCVDSGRRDGIYSLVVVINGREEEWIHLDPRTIPRRLLREAKRGRTIQIKDLWNRRFESLFRYVFKGD